MASRNSDNSKTIKYYNNYILGGCNFYKIPIVKKIKDSKSYEIEKNKDLKVLDKLKNNSLENINEIIKI